MTPFGVKQRQRLGETTPRPPRTGKIVHQNSTLAGFLPIENLVWLSVSQPGTQSTGDVKMGKGNNSQRNDKKQKKPKQDKTKPAPKK